MYIRSYSKEFQKVSLEDVWSTLTDINHWTRWQKDVVSSSIEGPFQAGNHFLLQPKGMKPLKIALVDVHQYDTFTDCTTFFGAKMFDTYKLEATEKGVKISNQIKVSGLLKHFWYFVVGKNVADTVPEQVDSMIQFLRGRGIEKKPL